MTLDKIYISVRIIMIPNEKPSLIPMIERYKKKAKECKTVLRSKGNILRLTCYFRDNFFSGKTCQLHFSSLCS